MSQPQGKVSRRRLFAGAVTAVAIAAPATVLPTVAAPTQPEATAAKEPPERGGGYELSEHVKRYYQTAT
jgi:hypothetical protein